MTVELPSVANSGKPTPSAGRTLGGATDFAEVLADRGREGESGGEVVGRKDEVFRKDQILSGKDAALSNPRPVETEKKKEDPGSEAAMVAVLPSTQPSNTPIVLENPLASPSAIQSSVIPSPMGLGLAANIGQPDRVSGHISAVVGGKTDEDARIGSAYLVPAPGEETAGRANSPGPQPTPLDEAKAAQPEPVVFSEIVGEAQACRPATGSIDPGDSSASEKAPSTNIEQSKASALGMVQKFGLRADSEPVTNAKQDFGKANSNFSSTTVLETASNSTPTPNEIAPSAKPDVASENKAVSGAARRRVETEILRAADATPATSSAPDSISGSRESRPHALQNAVQDSVITMADTKAALATHAFPSATTGGASASVKAQAQAIEMKRSSNERGKEDNGTGVSSPEHRPNGEFSAQAGAKLAEVSPVDSEIRVADHLQNVSNPASAQVEPETSRRMPEKPHDSSMHTVDTPQRTAEAVPAITGLVHAARVVEKLGQSEMHIGLQTATFGNVEVHTVIRDTHVGLSIASEKGDLKALVAPEMSSLESSFRQHDLRLDSLQFHNQQTGYGAGPGSGNGQDPRSFRSARSFDVSQGALENVPEMSSEPITLPFNRGLNVHA